MIRVTDRTLSCLDAYDPTPKQLRALCALLLQTGADYTELSAAAYEKIGTLPENGRYILRIGDVPQRKEYRRFDRYVCRRSGHPAPPEVLTEMQVNDVGEVNFLRQYRGGMGGGVRLVGLDDVLCHNAQMAFGQIVKQVPGRAELCPENRYFCATAIAVEWILFGGRNVAAAFAGAGGCAPLEEVLMALRLQLRHKPNLDCSVFPAVRALMEEITGEKIPPRKAVIGAHIFDVEAGIHADGISKDPNIYEPFRPELVGAKRRFVLGKHSGRAAVEIKMREFGLEPKPGQAAEILKRVKQASVEKGADLSDGEFLELVRREGGRCDEG